MGTALGSYLRTWTAQQTGLEVTKSQPRPGAGSPTTQVHVRLLLADAKLALPPASMARDRPSIWPSGREIKHDPSETSRSDKSIGTPEASETPQNAAPGPQAALGPGTLRAFT